MRSTPKCASDECGTPMPHPTPHNLGPNPAKTSLRVCLHFAGTYVYIYIYLFFFSNVLHMLMCHDFSMVAVHYKKTPGRGRAFNLCYHIDAAEN